jgi:hypothetical protein
MFAFADIVLDDGAQTSFSYVYEQIDCQPTGHMIIGVSFLFQDESIMKVLTLALENCTLDRTDVSAHR